MWVGVATGYIVSPPNRATKQYVHTEGARCFIKFGWLSSLLECGADLNQPLVIHQVNGAASDKPGKNI